MHILILALIAGLLIWAFFLRPRAGAKSCRWKKSPGRTGATLERWQCMGCGVDAFSRDGHAPKECKRGLRETQL